MKECPNRGKKLNLCNRSGFEIDLVVEEGALVDAIEIKVGQDGVGGIFSRAAPMAKNSRLFCLQDPALAFPSPLHPQCSITFPFRKVNSSPFLSE